MRADALAQPYLCTDATGVLVQAKDKCRTGHFWVLVAPALHVLFGYSPRHDSAGVDKLLAGYRGYLVADAHAVYDHLYADGTVVEVGCWAHQRRYLFSVSDAVRRTDTTRSGADRGRYPLCGSYIPRRRSGGSSHGSPGFTSKGGADQEDQPRSGSTCALGHGCDGWGSPARGASWRGGYPSAFTHTVDPLCSQSRGPSSSRPVRRWWGRDHPRIAIGRLRRSWGT